MRSPMLKSRGVCVRMRGETDLDRFGGYSMPGATPSICQVIRRDQQIFGVSGNIECVQYGGEEEVEMIDQACPVRNLSKKETQWFAAIRTIDLAGFRIIQHR